MNKQNTLTRCNVCEMDFSSYQQLVDHHRTYHLEQKSFMCEICGIEFSWYQNLLQHTLLHAKNGSSEATQTSRPEYHHSHTLQRKGKVFPFPDGNASPDIKYVCHICNRAFRYDFSYKVHVEAHVKNETVHNNEEETQNYICGICNKMFRQEYCLKVHLNWHLTTSTDVQTSESFTRNYKASSPGHPWTRLPRNPVRNESGRLEKLICPICNRGFKYEFSLTAHLNAHASQTAPNIEIDGSKEAECKNPLPSRRPPVAEMVNIHQSLSANHNMKATVAGPYLQNTLKPFANKYKALPQGHPLTRPPPNHVRSESGGLEKLICPICNRGFKYEFSLTAHLNAHAPQTAPNTEIDGTKEVECKNALPSRRPSVAEMVNIHQSLNAIYDMEETVGDQPHAEDSIEGTVVGTMVRCTGSETNILVTPKTEPAGDGTGTSHTSCIPNPFMNGPVRDSAANMNILVADSFSSWTSLDVSTDSSQMEPPRKRQRPDSTPDFSKVDVKPFLCTYCDNAFKLKVSLAIHLKMHNECQGLFI